MSTECLPNVGGNQHVGLAFGLTVAAGMATTLGAALAFCMPYSEGETNLFLAASLSVAAGVMLYVSFVEIFSVKAVESLRLCVDDRMAYLYATLCFFGGLLITFLFEVLLHLFEKWAIRRSIARDGARGTSKTGVGRDDSGSLQSTSTDSCGGGQVCNHSDTVDIQDRDGRETLSDVDALPSDSHPVAMDGDGCCNGDLVATIYTNTGKDKRKLLRMAIFAGIAIGFHNFPEGLATFVATLKQPHVGAAVAIAIGIHNIPEGICVAMPILYATGSKSKAFFWAALSGMFEVVGAFLGYIVLRNVFTNAVYGVLFGVVAGMMVYISLKELLPTAHRYDPENKVTSLFLGIGMVVMALSLVLFQFHFES
eukprot:CAMPEP_0184685272 /NCGR_PEP_ID=MMETSP0312-20130426/18314_1 /TAXON_ID=31354 /ORGANISM="Compsopogon coeruleus, Strain SAG 36.94" /LENGTH=366 /DNA_ID=CAMNT_0027139193 /DNA_START=181 /DNA_END=1281 /DNA_ORIENTATION=-